MTVTDPFDVDAEVRKLGIQLEELELSDTSVLGVCVGSPDFVPLVAVNRNCADANGLSGRRITLAHELCHLLFDRFRMRSLARFEGASDSDRLVEMRANAFAVELLVPRATLIQQNGEILTTEEELEPISTRHQISLTALSRHAENLRRSIP